MNGLVGDSMEIMVTGAAGFIGRNLIPILSKHCQKIYAVDNLNPLLYSSKIKNYNFKYLSSLKNIECIEVDTNNITKNENYRKVNLIINLAALPGQSLSWENTSEYIQNNISNVNNLIREFCLDGDLYLLQASTSSVYGRIATGGPDQILSPNNPYGVTKLAAENLIDAYSQNYDFNFSILRLFSVYGPHQRPDMGIYKFLSSILNGSEVKVYGDGTQSRSLTYVMDVVDAIIKVVDLKPSNQKIDISGNRVVTVNEIVSICENVVGKKAKINFVPTPVGDQDKTVGNIERAENLLGIKKYTSVEFGIKEQFTEMRRSTGS
jgi:nucleoside-diphosphate-sugar epimerase